MGAIGRESPPWEFWHARVPVPTIRVFAAGHLPRHIDMGCQGAVGRCAAQPGPTAGSSLNRSEPGLGA